MDNKTGEHHPNHERTPSNRSRGLRKNRIRFTEVVMMLRDKQKLQEQAPTVWDRSLFIFKRKNLIRRVATYITDSKYPYTGFLVITRF